MLNSRAGMALTDGASGNGFCLKPVTFTKIKYRKVLDLLHCLGLCLGRQSTVKGLDK